jgi:acyl carrier protein
VALSRDEVFERVKSALGEQLGVDEAEITNEASFQDDLDADSLDLVELVMGLEEKFDVTIPEEDLEGVATVGQAVDLVIKKADEKT